MKTQTKPIIALVTGPILLSGLLCQTVQAQLTPGGPGISGSSILADALGTSTGPEALIVSWSVVENLSDVYTYSYNVNNPTGDVLLGGNNVGQSEIVDLFAVDFNTTTLGAVLSGPTGGTVANTTTGGAYWLLLTPNIAAGSSSGALSFTSALPPSAGNATADDANPPSPWSSYPAGQVVPVPGTGNFPVPDTTSTMALLAGMMMLLPLGATLKKKA